MASHDYHQGPEGAVLYDGCSECDARASDALSGLLRLDAEKFKTLAGRMYEVEYLDKGSYLTDNEAALARTLYLISVLNERHQDVLTEATGRKFD